MTTRTTEDALSGGVAALKLKTVVMFLGFGSRLPSPEAKRLTLSFVI